MRLMYRLVTARRPGLWSASLSVAVLLAGCGSPAATPTATLPATVAPPAQWSDPHSGLLITVERQIYHRDYVLLLVTMRNRSARAYQPSGALGWAATSLLGPSSPGTTTVCDADFSRGNGLDFQSFPAHAVHRGWIRCDYNAKSYGFVLSWETHTIGDYVIRR